MTQKSDFNFWRVVTVIGLVLIGISYFTKKENVKNLQKKEKKTYPEITNHSLDLKSPKSDSSISLNREFIIKRAYYNGKFKIYRNPDYRNPEQRKIDSLHNLKSPNARELSDLLRNGHPVDSNSLFLKRIEPNISPNKLKNKDDSNSNNSIESFRDVNQKNKNIVDDIKNNKDND
tara:strand:+ start:151 stop:675 length:525 start_codon:yes stop_codon:yes gene_type:complete